MMKVERPKDKVQKRGKAAMPGAVVLSILIHAGLFLLATMLVVFTVVKKEPPQFEPPKAIERPKMRLKKPKARVKKSSRPRSASRIMTKKPTAMPALSLPDMGGMGGGLGDGFGDDAFDMLPDLSETTIFGEGFSTGNDFIGTLYHLQRSRHGGLAVMDKDMFREVLRKYTYNGWKERDLAKYYKLPKKLYATHFMVPPMVTPTAPDAFGDSEMDSFWFFMKYEGDLVYPEDITFRFWGCGDAYLVVRVNGKTVLIDGWPAHLRYLNYWQTSSSQSDNYLLGNSRMKVGDWITLKAGEPVKMQVLFGEWEGGIVSAGLLVEVKGVEYPTTRQGGPLLPAFKTQMLTDDQLDEIRKYLPEGEADLTSDLVFNDLGSGSSPQDEDSVDPPETAADPEIAEASPLHLWTCEDGKTIEGEFVTIVGNKVSLKSARGRMVVLPIHQLSEVDRDYLQIVSPPDLDLNFKKKSRQRIFPPDHSNGSNRPRAAFYDWSLQIRQDSSLSYNQELTVEYFVIGEEVSGNKMTLLDYQQAAFMLTEEDDRRFELRGRTTTLMEYSLNSETRGTKFDGYVALVTDTRGKIIAYKTSNDAFFSNLDKLRKLRVGNYFDKTFTRCSPTRPRPWY